MNGTVLIHHGIKGQKWGVRRFQNPDGTLTPAGKRRYAEDSDSYSNHNLSAKDVAKNMSQMTDKQLMTAYNRLAIQNNVKNMATTKKKDGIGKKAANRFVDQTVQAVADEYAKQAAKKITALVASGAVLSYAGWAVTRGKEIVNDLFRVTIDKV